jgi:sialate O-acetylesterase
VIAPRALPAPALLLAAAAPALADVSLPPILSEHAVLQAGRPVPVWGRADPGERVRVSARGRTAEAVAGPDGRWTATLPALDAGGPFDLVVEGRNRLVVPDVLAGEVWIASGQSNMAMAVAQCRDAEAEKAAADLAGIRFFTVPALASPDPVEEASGAWVVCSPAAVGAFSGAAYFFAREVHREAKVPVGILHASWGGTACEPWTPEEAVAAEPALKGLMDRWRKAIREYDPEEEEARYRKALERWKREAEEDRRAGRTPPRAPALPPHPRRNPQCPGSLWRGMVEPLLPYAVRGAIWYQGESNAGRAHQYRTLFPLMIRSWREARGDPGMPFLFVQLANFGRVAPSGGPSPWAELREAQLLALRSVPGTGMAVAVDVGDPADIHPKDKQAVGRRLALWALAMVHGREVEPSGPLFREAKAEGARLRLLFDHAAGLRTADGREPAGFAVAGPDGRFRPGRARVDGETVLVSDPAGGRPAAVRYAWADAPDAANLVNGAGLPASPFRTDAWKGVTEGKE